MKKELKVIEDKDYTNLLEISKETKILNGVFSLLDWDRETYMPPDAAEIRSHQLELLAGIIHKQKTSKKFSSTLSKLIDIDTGKVIKPRLPFQQVAALKEWRRDYLKAICLPASFVKAFAKLSSQAIIVWRTAKLENAFMKFAPFLERLIEMSRKKAEYLGYREHPYDALVDEYEPHMTTNQLTTLFGGLQKSITSLLKNILATKQVQDDFLFGKFPQEKQLNFGKLLLDAMGYNQNMGRLDLSTHPFSSSAHPTDSRITTRIHPSSLMSNLSTILHEGGHSLYEMGLPIEHYGSPLCEAISMAMHESQSRWWETRIGQSKSFWHHFFPELKKVFKEQLHKISLDQFYLAINKVEPTFIRVEADEVTYSLHVILRFEIERDLIAGTLSVRDIPAVWNHKMEQYLQITPPTDSEGCLQDIHWSMGAFGYFPSYTLGNLFAAHLFLGFETAFPDWEKRVSKGELSFIKEWLMQNVHQYGRQYTSTELLKKITKNPFSEKAFIDYLNEKYNKIYQIKPNLRSKSR